MSSCRLHRQSLLEAIEMYHELLKVPLRVLAFVTFAMRASHCLITKMCSLNSTSFRMVGACWGNQNSILFFFMEDASRVC